MRVCSNQMSEENRGNFTLVATRRALYLRATRIRSGIGALRNGRLIVYCRRRKNFGVEITPRFKGVIQSSGK
jgi:hypothetical protein